MEFYFFLGIELEVHHTVTEPPRHVKPVCHRKKKSRSKAILYLKILRLSGQTSVFYLVFFVFESLLGTRRQRNLERLGIFVLKTSVFYLMSLLDPFAIYKNVHSGTLTSLLIKSFFLDVKILTTTRNVDTYR